MVEAFLTSLNFSDSNFATEYTNIHETELLIHLKSLQSSEINVIFDSIKLLISSTSDAENNISNNLIRQNENAYLRLFRLLLDQIDFVNVGLENVNEIILEIIELISTFQSNTNFQVEVFISLLRLVEGQLNSRGGGRSGLFNNNQAIEGFIEALIRVNFKFNDEYLKGFYGKFEMESVYMTRRRFGKEQIWAKINFEVESFLDQLKKEKRFEKFLTRIQKLYE